MTQTYISKDEMYRPQKGEYETSINPSKDATINQKSLQVSKRLTRKEIIDRLNHGPEEGRGTIIDTEA